ncbi:MULTISPECIES: pyruvate formate-lyase-activating protein [unclassified Bacillus (in: firmicutes)]|uniref:pyruvate formate-lyase-activating protein n=1 Tax=unclassified Bacillus (in: firmicutes) TaxID=185979 RepID=UPI0008EC51E3|nr:MULTISPECIES: pyruvate formate-lyase-activating protein [unclassified Bacillus (in: firmicutes)]SFJ41248.1 pyruvate formate lyase activating enzyme [Bacillus sp. 71mf]SFT15379.1 pyruvate formate lyase activating enzyme [Bacillus sp. 103mf]
MIKGRIHSVESCGTVDGPGIRYIIFTQGCLLRCQYCHNADTWEIGKGKEITVEEVMQDVTCYLPFMEASGGGITVSGGEPLLQLDFLIELFKKCKEIGIHTTIDSSGGCYSEDEEFQRKLDILMEYTDLVLLDLKHIDSKKHRKLTGKPNEHILQFARYLSDKKKPIWVRHVLVPGVTDSTEDLEKLAAFIQSLDNVQKIEVLPYHKLGVYKWEALGHKYPLQGVEPPTEECVQKAKSILGAV